MFKITITIMIFLFLSIKSVYSMDLNVKSIDKKYAEAVLIDMETGDEWVVFEGDNIQGWKVNQINPNSVVIKKEAEGEKPYGIVRRLTLPNKISVMPLK